MGQSKVDALTVVIKLQSSETLNNLTEGEKYIDLERTYGDLAKREKKTPYQLWQEYVKFNYGLATDKKFTNVFKYYDFNIKVEEVQDGFKVIFEYRDLQNGIKEIVYKLEKLEDNLKVVNISYT
jgi:hypothetical protein